MVERPDSSLPKHVAPQAHRRRGRKYPPDTFVWVDGVFVREDEAPLPIGRWYEASRAGVYTRLMALGTRPRHFAEHWDWLMRQAKLARLPEVAYLTPEELSKAITGLLNKMMWFGRVMVRISLYPQTEISHIGMEVHSTRILITAQQMESPLYLHREQGLILDYFPGWRVPMEPLARLSWMGSPLPWLVNASIRTANRSDLVLLNVQGRVVSAPEATLYARFGNRICTPPLAEGVIFDPIRIPFEGAVFQQLGNGVEERPLTQEELMRADEVMLVSTANGIEWVVGLATQRYRTRYAKALLEALNVALFPDQR